jgi:tRNA nucleotidyltransferase (CCA-adding enzyme)
LPFVPVTELPRRRVTEAIIVDTQSVSAIKGMGDSTALTVIDHHPQHGDPKPNTSYTCDEVGATTSLLVEKLRELRVPLTPLEATLLLLGIYEDTGSLSYPTTTARDLRCAAWLLEQEANLTVASAFLRHPLDERYQPVYRQLVENVEWRYLQDQAILISVAHLGEYLDELSTLAHKLDDIFNPDASVMLFVFAEQIQMVARSSTAAVDVGEVARDFGGGGHSSAAAALIQGSDVEQTRQKLYRLLEEHIKPPVTVREIMSFGVHTLHPDMSLSQAEVLMRRYGHEGFPVVEDRRLLGVLTRRELDRALHHGLDKATVRSYMHTGEVAVSPWDSVTAVQKVMNDQGLGQIPVVQDGRLLGIVTRTDLIKLWTAHEQPPRRQEIQRLLMETLPMPLFAILERARDVANEMGFSLYVVGGFVRDLLLGTPTLDLDLVVEGDAISLAKELAKGLRARVVAHGRFGVAKVILGGTAGTNLPPWLDFVTARTEFYQHPTALPEVERSSIKQDLYRRDFTINTMAICLDRDRRGELLDFYGGERDLKDRLIRVLHNLSFVEDPTRILRAVRLEQRLGFVIETRTAELVDDALGLLDRMSGARLRHELELILDEKTPSVTVRRLSELGVLSHLSRGLVYDEWLAAKFAQVEVMAEEPQAKEPEEAQDEAAEYAVSHPEVDRRAMYLALLTYRLSKAHLERFVERLKFSQELAKYLDEVRDLRAKAWRIDRPGLKPSRIYQLLRHYSARALLAFSIALDSPEARDNVLQYLHKLRWVRPTIKGEYLREQGVQPGPVYGKILNEVLNARLDGRIRTTSDEEELAQRLLKAWRNEG